MSPYIALTALFAQASAPAAGSAPPVLYPYFQLITGATAALLTIVGLIITVKVLRANHDWNRRHYAAQLVAKWNDETAAHRKFIDTARPGLVDLDAKSQKLVELTGEDARAIYLSAPGTPLWELRFHMIELLNYFEAITVAYANEVADQGMIEGSLKNVLVRWHTILRHFIEVVESHRGYAPWLPYRAQVEEWSRLPQSGKKKTDVLIRTP